MQIFIAFYFSYGCSSNSGEVRLMLWDTAGQEEFDAITRAYYRGAQACVIVFSTTDRHSFTSVRKWRKKVNKPIIDCEVNKISAQCNIVILI